MADALRLLVIDGYAAEGREELRKGGASEGGALYAAMLRRHAPDAWVDVVHPADADATLPQGVSLDDYDGAAWTGSSLTILANGDPRVRRQIELARRLHAARVPSFGSCWAAQIACVAAGGRCVENPKGREFGLARKLTLSPEGRAHPLYAGKPPVFDAFTSHGDMVSVLPDGATLLASNDFTRVQAVAVERDGVPFWAVQYHPEYDLHELARLCAVRADVLVAHGTFRDRAAAAAHVELLETLHGDPSRRDLAWRLGIDGDVLDPTVRECEVRNWLERAVLPAVRR